MLQSFYKIVAEGEIDYRVIVFHADLFHLLML